MLGWVSKGCASPLDGLGSLGRLPSKRCEIRLQHACRYVRVALSVRYCIFTLCVSHSQARGRECQTTRLHSSPCSSSPHHQTTLTQYHWSREPSCCDSTQRNDPVHVWSSRPSKTIYRNANSGCRYRWFAGKEGSACAESLTDGSSCRLSSPSFASCPDSLPQRTRLR